MPVEFRLLRAVDLRVDGVPVDLGHARQLSVLAILLVDANQVVSADQLTPTCGGPCATSTNCTRPPATAPRSPRGTTVPDVGYHRYEGYPLEEKIAWVAQGAGTSSLAAARDALRALGRDLVESETRLRGLVTRLGGLWLGTSGATPVDAHVVTGGLVRARAATAGERGVLAVIDGDRMTVRELPANQVITEVTALAGPARRGPVESVSVRADASTRPPRSPTTTRTRWPRD